MPDSAAPSSELPPWAVGNYPAGTDSWSATPRRVATNVVTLAAAGLIPNEKTQAQWFNEWLARNQEWFVFFRGGDPASTANGLAGQIYGSGSDGDVVIPAGTTTITRDMYYRNLTVQAGGRLAANGFRIFVAGTLTIAAGGFVSANGIAATGATGGGASPTGSIAGGSAGANGLTSGAPGLNGIQGSSNSNALGGQGGAGGADDQGNTGGAGGTLTAPTAAAGGWEHLNAALGRSDGATSSSWRAGSGGGSGAVHDGGTSGGGGGGGGVLVLWARMVDNQGTIEANGGAGGDAVVLGSDGIGGGGGGGGGVVFLVHRETLNGAGTGVVQALGGAGGQGGTSQATPPGQDGATGSAGRVLLLVA